MCPNKHHQSEHSAKKRNMYLASWFPVRKELMSVALAIVLTAFARPRTNDLAGDTCDTYFDTKPVGPKDESEGLRARILALDNPFRRPRT